MIFFFGGGGVCQWIEIKSIMIIAVLVYITDKIWKKKKDFLVIVNIIYVTKKFVLEKSGKNGSHLKVLIDFQNVNVCLYKEKMIAIMNKNIC